ncbi:AAA family ATPase [Methanocrinis sp.]|uniref:AAA family ATPase n=1 Tax=Methanocrinis sp. TaxID=3101522 RepID=UPI003D0C964C
MYKSIKINKFRGFREFNMDSMARINLIAGKNNVGKTAFLEAMFLHCGAYNPSLTLGLDKFRGFDKIHIELGSTQSPWDSLFNNFDKYSAIEIEGKFTDGSVRKINLKAVQPFEESPEKGPIIQYGTSTLENIPLDSEDTVVLRLDYEEESAENESRKKKSGSSFMSIGPKGVSTPIIKPPPFLTIFQPARYRFPPQEDAKRFSNLEIIGEEDMLLEALKIFEPGLKHISVVASGGGPVLYGDIGLSQMLRLAYMGDGMSKLASIVLAIGNAKDGVVLVDEIENGFHHSMMQKVWAAIDRAARRSNTQVFATTHSLECIIAAHKAFIEAERYDLLVHRLDRIDDTVKDVTFSKLDLDTAFEFKMDVR